MSTTTNNQKVSCGRHWLRRLVMCFYIPPLPRYKVVLGYDGLIKQWYVYLLRKHRWWHKWKIERHRDCNGEVVAARWSLEFDVKIKHAG